MLRTEIEIIEKVFFFEKFFEEIELFPIFFREIYKIFDMNAKI